MKTSQLQNVQISDAALAWLQAKYAAVDSRDAQAYAQFLAPDCQLAFANNPLAVGREALIEGIQHFWDAIGGLDHSFTNIFGTDDHLAAEALIDYTRKDGRIVPVPCVTTIKRNSEGLASHIQIYIDTTPIFN